MGSCFYQASCRGGMEGPREKLTPVGQEGATCLDFKCIPIHASLRTSCSLCVQNLVNFPEAEVSLDSFNMLGCRHHGLF